MTGKVILDSLPIDDPYRNTPLITIGAYYKPLSSPYAREVLPSFGIAKVTYNQLGEVWLKDTEWYATIPLVTPEETRMDIVGSNGNEGLNYEDSSK